MIFYPYQLIPGTQLTVKMDRQRGRTKIFNWPDLFANLITGQILMECYVVQQ